jgi:hypothetical protein
MDTADRDTRTLNAIAGAFHSAYAAAQAADTDEETNAYIARCGAPLRQAGDIPATDLAGLAAKIEMLRRWDDDPVPAAGECLR